MKNCKLICQPGGSISSHGQLQCSRLWRVTFRPLFSNSDTVQILIALYTLPTVAIDNYVCYLCKQYCCSLINHPCVHIISCNLATSCQNCNNLQWDDNLKLQSCWPFFQDDHISITLPKVVPQSLSRAREIV